MTDEELIRETRKLLLDWQKSEPGADDKETVVQIIELFESSGRPLIAHVHAESSPANDEP